MPNRPVVRKSIALRAAVTAERATLAHGHSRARFLFELDALRPAGGERHLVVALDRSSSMKGERLAQALKALRTFIERAPEGMYLSALAYDAEIRHLFPRTRLDRKSRPLLLQRLEGIRHGLGTDHSGALLEGFNLARKGEGTSHLLLVTDGYASRGLTHLDQLVDLVQRGRGETTLSTLGIGRWAEGWVLGALARTGGGIYQHVAPTDGQELDMISNAIGAELGLLHHLYATDVQLRFHTQPPVKVRKLYYRGPAWKEGEMRVVRLPRLVEGEPLRLSFEVENGTDLLDPKSWGLLEVRLTSTAGEEQRFELPLPTDFADAPSAPDPRVTATILKHRVGIAIIDACATGDREATRAAEWLSDRLNQLRAIARDHQIDDPDLDGAFAQAAELRAMLGERMDEERKNRLSEMAELFTRDVSSNPGSILDADIRTRVTGLEMLKLPKKE